MAVQKFHMQHKKYLLVPRMIALSCVVSSSPSTPLLKSACSVCTCRLYCRLMLLVNARISVKSSSRSNTKLQIPFKPAAKHSMNHMWNCCGQYCKAELGTLILPVTMSIVLQVSSSFWERQYDGCADDVQQHCAILATIETESHFRGSADDCMLHHHEKNY